MSRGATTYNDKYNNPKNKIDFFMPRVVVTHKMIITVLRTNIELSEEMYTKYIDDAREYVEKIDPELLTQELLIHEDDRAEYEEYCHPQYYKYYSTDEGYKEFLLTHWQKGLYINYIQVRINLLTKDDDMEFDGPTDWEDEMCEEEAEEMNDLIKMMKVT